MSDADLDAVRQGLGSRVERWPDVRWVDETGSTNADLAVLARAGHRAPVVLVADHQTNGRGRLDRRWESPPGANLLVSILLDADGAPAAWGWRPAAVAVAAAAACRTAGVEVDIKWPNDLHHGGAKLAGLLAEAVTATRTLVVGIGINVGWPDPPAAELGATSLRALGSSVDRPTLLAELLLQLDRWWSADPASLATVYRERCTTVGCAVRVELVGGGELRGRAIGIDDAGALLVQVGVSVEVVTVGDVFHLRAEP